MRSARAVQLFRPRGPVVVELEQLQALRGAHPEYAEQVLLQGEELVRLAGLGDVDGVAQLALGCREGELLSWSVARMFKAACAAGHVAMVRFMCENGVDKQHPGLRQLLHALVSECEHGEGVAALAKVAPVLVRELGFEVNAMRPGDGYTPLHLACLSAQPRLFKLLVLLGADVNAVANDDSLPATCAARAAAAATSAREVVGAGEITDCLRRLGASSEIEYVSSCG